MTLNETSHLRGTGCRWACSKERDARDLDDLIAFLDASPSPWHAVDSAADSARAPPASNRSSSTDDCRPATCRLPRLRRPRRGAGRVAAGGASADAGVDRSGSSARTPTRRACGSSRGPTPAARVAATGVEVYGGVLLNSWLDRDLGHRRPGRAGRRVVRRCLRSTKPSAACRSWRSTSTATSTTRAGARQAAAPDAGVGHRHRHVTASSASGSPSTSGVAPQRHRLVGAVPVRPHAAGVLGADERLLASGRLDNQVSCWAAVDAHRATAESATVAPTSVIALFDHEEVGSESTTGAAGPLLEHVLERLDARHGWRRSSHSWRSWQHQHVRVGRQRARRAPQLSRAARARPPPDRQPRPGDQGQQQPALRDERRSRRAMFQAACRSAPTCRGRCSSAATTCRAARRSARSPPPGWASRPSMSACRSCRCTRPASCAACDDPISLAAACAHYFAG